MENLLRKKIKENVNPNSIFFDGLDNAIVGIVHRAGDASVVCYDSDKAVNILMNEMNQEDALYHFYKLVTGINQENYENYPVFIEDINYIKYEE
jgi:hypothetical protein